MANIEGEHYLSVSEIAKGPKGGNKLPATDELIGNRLKFCFEIDKMVIEYFFHDVSSLTWEILEGPDKGRSGTEKYEATRVDSYIYFVDYVKNDTPDVSVSMALDLNTKKVTIIKATAPDKDSASQGFLERLEKGVDLSLMKVKFLHANVNPPSKDTPVIPHERTTDLIGKRIKYDSGRGAVEHIYLNERFYTWHALEGSEKGLAATDPCAYFKITTDIYLFAWWEHIMPAVGVILINFKEMRFSGKVFGPDFKKGENINYRLGALASLLNETKY